MIKSKTYYVLDSAEINLVKEINKIQNWDSLTPFEQKRLRLLSLISKLGHRNESLAKLLYLKYYPFLTNEKIPNFSTFLPRRGKKPPNELSPLKYIMRALKCSHRSAQSYQLLKRACSLETNFSTKPACCIKSNLDGKKRSS
jgi:hypothetical protein